MATREITLAEGESPPDIIYVIWGNPDDPYIAEYRASQRSGIVVGKRARDEEWTGRTDD